MGCLDRHLPFTFPLLIDLAHSYARSRHVDGDGDGDGDGEVSLGIDR